MKQHYISVFHLLHFSSKKRRGHARIGKANVSDSGMLENANTARIETVASETDLYERYSLTPNMVEHRLGGVESNASPALRHLIAYVPEPYNSSYKMDGKASAHLALYVYTLILRHPSRLDSEQNREMIASALGKSPSAVVDDDFVTLLQYMNARRLNVEFEDAYVVKTITPVVMSVENPVLVDGNRIVMPLSNNRVLFATLKVSPFMRQSPMFIPFFRERANAGAALYLSELLLNAVWTQGNGRSAFVYHVLDKDYVMKRLFAIKKDHPADRPKLTDFTPVFEDFSGEATVSFRRATIEP